MSKGMLGKARLGRTNLEVCRLGLGTGTASLTVDCCRRAIDLGIDYIDSARSYGSEKTIGKAIKGRREQLIITSKTVERTREKAEAELHQSLRDLDTDYVDIFHLHCLDKQEELDQIRSPGGALEAVLKAQEQGKVRFIAVSAHRWEQMGRNLETGLFDSCLVWYNCAELEPEEMVFPVAEKQDAGVAIMKATGWGRMLEPPPDWTGEVPTAVDLCRFVLSNPAADVLLYQPTEENEIVGLVRAVEDSQPSSEEETQWLKEYGRAVRKTGRLDG